MCIYFSYSSDYLKHTEETYIFEFINFLISSFYHINLEKIKINPFLSHTHPSWIQILAGNFRISGRSQPGLFDPHNYSGCSPNTGHIFVCPSCHLSPQTLSGIHLFFFSIFQMKKTYPSSFFFSWKSTVRWKQNLKTKQN